jgi:hypothetical protein
MAGVEKLIDRWVKLWFSKHAWRTTRCNGFVIRTGHNIGYCYAYVGDGGHQALDKIPNSPLLCFLLELKPRFKQVLHSDDSQDVKADRYLQRQHFTDGINQHLCLITLKDTFLTMDQRNLFYFLF